MESRVGSTSAAGITLPVLDTPGLPPDIARLALALGYEARLCENDVVHYAFGMHRRREDFSDGDIVDRINAHDWYDLVVLPLDKIDLEEWDVSHSLVDRYAALVSHYPPIVFDAESGSIIDGIHRANAAHQRGDKAILAYVGGMALRAG